MKVSFLRPETSELYDCPYCGLCVVVQLTQAGTKISHEIPQCTQFYDLMMSMRPSSISPAEVVLIETNGE